MRELSMPIRIFGVLTTVLLLVVVNPWFQIPDDQAALRDLVTYGFWISFIVLLVLLFMERKQPGGETVEVEGPAFTRFLFSNSKAGLFWLPIRLFLGFSWLDAGWHKFTDEAWMNGSGEALGGRRWARAVAIPEEGRPAITYEWYRGFLQLLLDNGAETWFSYLIVFGEIAVGIGLIFRPHRLRGVLRSADEHVVPAGRFSLHQPGPVHPGRGPHPGPGRSPATTVSTAGCCRCLARRGIPPS